jgi:hypothetical protein
MWQCGAVNQFVLAHHGFGFGFGFGFRFGV